jgi:hypothetical protein
MHRAQRHFELRIAENGKNSAIAKRSNITDNVKFACIYWKKVTLVMLEIIS